MQLFYFGESSNIYIAILKRHKIEGKADRTAAKCDIGNIEYSTQLL